MAFIDRDMPRFDTEQTRNRFRAIQDDEEQRRRDLLTRLMGLRMSGDAVGFGWRAGAEGGRNVGAEIALQNEINLARSMRPEQFQEIIEKGETKAEAGSWGISRSSYSDEQPGGTKTVTQAGGPHVGRRRKGFFTAEEYEESLRKQKKGFSY